MQPSGRGVFPCFHSTVELLLRDPAFSSCPSSPFTVTSPRSASFQASSVSFGSTVSVFFPDTNTLSSSEKFSSEDCFAISVLPRFRSSSTDVCPRISSSGMGSTIPRKEDRSSESSESFSTMDSPTVSRKSVTSEKEHAHNSSIMMKHNKQILRVFITYPFPWAHLSRESVPSELRQHQSFVSIQRHADTPLVDKQK